MSVIETPTIAPAPREITEQDVRERAAWYIEEFGWCQDQSGTTSDGSPAPYNSPTAAKFCLLGAWWRALDELVDDQNGFPLPDFGVGVSLGETSKHPAAEWNDRPGRRASEVAAVLRGRA